MTESGTDSATISWSVAECPFTIESSARVLDDIRLAVTDALFSLPKGGAEIGGILLGSFETGRLAIVEHAALDCEHAHGPGFTLSPADEGRLMALLAAHGDSGTGVRPVGWYHSHTRSGIFLSDADLLIYQRFFPEPWQVAMVMKPHTFQPARIGFFFRGTDGSVHAEASYQEATLDALPIHQLPSPVPTAPPGPAMRRARPDMIPPIVIPPIVPEPVPLWSAPVAVPAAPQESSLPEPAQPEAPQPELAQAALAQPEAGPARPEAELTQPEAALAQREPELAQPKSPVELPVPRLEIKHRSHLWLWVAGMIGVSLLVLAGFQTRHAWLPRAILAIRPAPPVPSAALPLGLNIVDREGQLQINWNRSSPAILRAAGATLEISDGGPVPVAIQLDKAQIQTGSFTYARQAEKVDVKLVLRQSKGPDLREGGTFMGKLPERRPPGESPETQKQREEMAIQAAKTEKLEKDVEAMRKELRRQQQRRLTNQAPDK
jgi:proteasome lid subunit RPN8/RPN11